MPSLDFPLALLLIFCLISALAFEFINGFHDTANAVATVIYTHALKPPAAVIWSGIWNFIGVNVGGIAVAVGIVNLLPIEALTDSNIYHNISLVMSLIITAILWNLGTWYLGIPCSSSHALIGSITGVSIGYVLLPDNHEVLLNWVKVKDAGLSLLISPLIGFGMAWVTMLLLKLLVRNKTIFREPPAKKAPPLLIRSVLILTSTFVSFSHGSNDGQKGVGLVMIILIAIVPARFAVDHTLHPAKLRSEIVRLEAMLSGIDRMSLSSSQSENYDEMQKNIRSIDQKLTSITKFSSLSGNSAIILRKDILYLSRKSSLFLNYLESEPLSGIDKRWVRKFDEHISTIKGFTEYSPWWVIFLISVSLGLGTMIGWKRIVITLGEKIGKSKLTYAQGAAANLVAAATISGSSFLGLPVSTTHVLSSGIAGTMVSGNGMKNLQGRTLVSIGIAWLITIPVTLLFSGVLFLLIRLLLPY